MKKSQWTRFTAFDYKATTDSIQGSRQSGHISLQLVIFPLVECSVGKCVSPALAMPHRGMASLASVGLDVKPWLSASLAWLNTLPASTDQEKAKG
ncbi:MAG: hypothetical protein WC530_02965 [Candidatus Omnitrophota bacterium]